METTTKTVKITTLTPSEGKALKKGDTYSTGVTAVDVSGWEEVSVAEYEAWKEAEKAKAEEERLKQ